jgi:hypothetical protein
MNRGTGSEPSKVYVLVRSERMESTIADRSVALISSLVCAPVEQPSATATIRAFRWSWRLFMESSRDCERKGLPTELNSVVERVSQGSERPMIRNLAARFTLMTLAVAACGPSSQPDATSSDSSGAVADAKARGQDLANSNQTYQPVRFVSDIEQVRPPRPVRKPQPEVVVREGTDSVAVEPVPAPATSPEERLTAVQSESTVHASSAPRVPSIVPRDAPLPAAVGASSGDWRGNDPGPDMGTVIGVVLRGGRGDPGHCPRHPRPPTQIPNRIPR